MMTVEMSLAMAIIRGDRVAARALADRIIEEDATTPEEREAALRQRLTDATAIDGYALYRMPEFQALCRLLGIPWGLPTINMTIRIAEGEVVVIEHVYQGRAPG